jgi:hypothetical protein
MVSSLLIFAHLVVVAIPMICHFLRVSPEVAVWVNMASVVTIPPKNLEVLGQLTADKAIGQVMQFKCDVSPATVFTTSGCGLNTSRRVTCGTGFVPRIPACVSMCGSTIYR